MLFCQGYVKDTEIISYFSYAVKSSLCSRFIIEEDVRKNVTRVRLKHKCVEGKSHCKVKDKHELLFREVFRCSGPDERRQALRKT